MSEDISGKTVVITGAGNGIGRALALGFLADGAKVVAADVNEAGLADAARAGAVSVVADVTDPAAVQAMIDTAMTETGAVHVLFNNAGVAGGGRIDAADQQALAATAFQQGHRLLQPGAGAAGEGDDAVGYVGLGGGGGVLHAGSEGEQTRAPDHQGDDQHGDGGREAGREREPGPDPRPQGGDGDRDGAAAAIRGHAALTRRPRRSLRVVRGRIPGGNHDR